MTFVRLAYFLRGTEAQYRALAQVMGDPEPPSAAGGMALSWLATRYRDGMVSRLGFPKVRQVR